MECTINIPHPQQLFLPTKEGNLTSFWLKAASLQVQNLEGGQVQHIIGHTFSKVFSVVSEYSTLIAFVVLTVFALGKAIRILGKITLTNEKMSYERVLLELKTFLLKTGLASGLFILPMSSDGQSFVVNSFRFIINLSDQLAYSIGIHTIYQMINALNDQMDKTKNLVVYWTLERMESEKEKVKILLFGYKEELTAFNECVSVDPYAAEIFASVYESLYEKAQNAINAVLSGRVLLGELLNERERKVIDALEAKTLCRFGFIRSEKFEELNRSVERYNSAVSIGHEPVYEIEKLFCSKIKDKVTPYVSKIIEGEYGWLGAVLFYPTLWYYSLNAIQSMQEDVFGKYKNYQTKSIVSNITEAVSDISLGEFAKEVFRNILLISLPPGYDIYHLLYTAFLELKNTLINILSGVLTLVLSLAGGPIAKIVTFFAGDIISGVLRKVLAASTAVLNFLSTGVIDALKAGIIAGIVIVAAFIVNFIFKLLPILAILLAAVIRFVVYLLDVTKFTLTLPFYSVRVSVEDSARSLKDLTKYAIYFLLYPTLIVVGALFAIFAYQILTLVVELIQAIVLHEFLSPVNETLDLIKIIIAFSVFYVFSLVVTVLLYRLVYKFPETLVEFVGDKVTTKGQIAQRMFLWFPKF